MIRSASGRRVRLATVVAGVAAGALAASPAVAQDVSINFGTGAGLTERVMQLIALLTVSVAARMTTLHRARSAVGASSGFTWSSTTTSNFLRSSAR